MRLRVHLARLISRLSDLFEPECPGGCRQPPNRCTCDPMWRWL